jgi:glucose/arabinose dehydrogenase
MRVAILKSINSIPFVLPATSRISRIFLSTLFIWSILTPEVCAQGTEELGLKPHAIHLQGRNLFYLSMPAALTITPAAEGLKRVRFMAKAPDGRIFVTTLHDLSDNSQGAVYILDGLDEQSGRFASVTPYLNNLHNPNSIAFYRDSTGQYWFYLALTDRLLRYKFTLGEKSPASQPEVLASYPAYGLSYKYGGWHLTRTITFGQGASKDLLYVTVGSSCNACDEEEQIRATLSVMDADGKHQRIVARGLRNAVGMRFVSGTLYLTNMGADHLGDDQPDDPMFAISEQVMSAGKTLDYGWPHCYYSSGKATADPKFTPGPGRLNCDQASAAFAYFGAHSSPLGLEYFGGPSDSVLLKDHFLVALHGASNKQLDRGYRVGRVDRQGHVENFITGFIKDGVVRGRPCDILKLNESSFLLTDDYANVVYYIQAK